MVSWKCPIKAILNYALRPQEVRVSKMPMVERLVLGEITNDNVTLIDFLVSWQFFLLGKWATYQFIKSVY